MRRYQHYAKALVNLLLYRKVIKRLLQPHRRQQYAISKHEEVAHEVQRIRLSIEVCILRIFREVVQRFKIIQKQYQPADENHNYVQDVLDDEILPRMGSDAFSAETLQRINDRERSIEVENEKAEQDYNVEVSPNETRFLPILSLR